MKKENRKEVKIELDKLLEPYLPRLHYDAEETKKLAETIREHGMLQNIILNKTSRGYIPIAGTRRIKALQHLGIKYIPDEKHKIRLGHEVKILEISDKQAYEMSLIENEVREELNSVEKGYAFSKMIKEGYTQQQVADIVKKTQGYVANNIRLTKLPQYVQYYIITRVITERHGRAFLRLLSYYSQRTPLDNEICRELKAPMSIAVDTPKGEIIGIESYEDLATASLLLQCLEKKWSVKELNENIDWWLFNSTIRPLEKTKELFNYLGIEFTADQLHERLKWYDGRRFRNKNNQELCAWHGDTDRCEGKAEVKIGEFWYCKECAKERKEQVSEGEDIKDKETLESLFESHS